LLRLASPERANCVCVACVVALPSGDFFNSDQIRGREFPRRRPSNPSTRRQVAKMIVRVKINLF
jgi:hypothetical protein